MKLNRDKINHISNLIVRDFEKRDELDYKVSLNDIRLELVKTFTRELSIDDEADTHVRKTLASYSSKTMREGTPEWEILYQKHWNEYMTKRGL